MAVKSVQRATMTIDEAARVLGIGRASAYEAARRGELPNAARGPALASFASRARAIRPTADAAE